MTTALYRRYRPETFAEVIGQEHVTAPLMQALRSGRVNHAYLFSGPRGCGKTTSARILARTLNCAQNTAENPLATPCGECPSCLELARGGPGSLDVVEIDAASHNGVDDARDLRERATFAPARDRYKIFILDEAHMVTPQGFNALLKIVEEPPPHIKFVFATTEPDKVIGTIRSRTHHYPFRLVPPDVLGPYLEQLCASEGVELGGGVVPLVTRAGGGSVRDSLSVLDQLIAGATDGVVEYDTAVGLLGFTHATLLDDVVDALAARDGASIFRVVDQVIATGHEPRRFVEDVLERLRDLIVIAVSGDAAEAVLRGLPADQLERMRAQAGHLGVAELSRAADLVNGALTEMTGATSPRLHLELLCARLLLPGADDGTEGLAARIDRLERGAVSGGGLPSAASVPATGAPDGPREPVGAPAAAPATAGGLSGAAAARAALQASRRPGAPDAPAPDAPAPDAAQPAPAEPGPAEPVPAEPGPAEPGSAETGADEPEPGPAEPVDPPVAEEPVAAEEPAAADPAEPEPEPGDVAAQDQGDAADVEPPEPPAVPPAPAPAPTGADTTAEMVRRRWEEVVANIGSPVTRALVGPNAQVASLDGGVLRLGFAAAGMARTFSQPRHVDAVAESVYQTLGVQVRVEATVDDGRSGGGGSAPPAGGPGGSGGSGAAEPPAPSSPSPSAAMPPADPGTGAPDAPDDDGGWPAVARPGSASAGSAGAAPVATVSAAAAPAAGPRASAPAPGPAAGGGVAVAERPARSTADDADAAWLAGTPSAEPASWAREPAPAGVPGPDGGAEAPPEDPGPPPWAQEPVQVAQPQPAPSAAPPAATGGPQVRETPRQAAERRVREAQEAGGPARSVHAPGTDDEPSADDPDITSVGLVGVPLVVRVLDGKVIDEVTEQP